MPFRDRFSIFSSGLSFSEKLTSILICFGVMAVGLGLFKYAPMSIWGEAIQFDASFHITATIFLLYIIWYFIDQNPRWRLPFFILAASLVAIVALQRVIVEAHNELGILGALAISAVAIILSRPTYFLKRLSF